ncbi:AMP-binding protein [Williamsia sp. 1135]|uniref:AMP-binding protein n=1 Tax=Williamsia sp. 1135 TaxID=1889262 RepID=UPI000A10308F|nr:AMP-binding protein [Williamsia sp. 1135]ORM24110.1 acyl-CoA synthetase [Williamsia sp. 1135]
MFPGNFVATTPDKVAVVRPATGESITYAELDRDSTKVARYLRDLGLGRGDSVAMVSTNDIRMLVIYWAAVRSGMYVTAINNHLTPDETNYILGDCGAVALFASAEVADAVSAVDQVPTVTHRIAWAGDLAGFESYDEILAAASDAPLDDQPRGQDMLYSSGTTGRPKGIKVPLQDGQVNEISDPYTAVFSLIYGFDQECVYLCPAPLYHAAPLRYCGMVNSVGGTVVMMDRFDAETALELIDEYKVTHSQWVPTMFIRMLKLPEEVRTKYDVSSLKIAIHAAAPCPPEVKQAMIAWWGPVIHEYYASTEGSGATFINSEQALAHPGSVGQPLLGVIRICADDGTELPVGEIGTVYFERDELPFEYYNDPQKTKEAQHPVHPAWTTSGDVGYVDAEGFLYLTDRKSFMIISGGVNIYPQEAENILIGHPAVFDIGIIGIPDPDLGEVAKACVQLEPGIEATDELATELTDFARSRLAHYKVPKSIDFVDSLPRTPTGKLVKRELQARYT